MTIKLNSLARWLTLEPKMAITFDKAASGEAARRVRLSLNLERWTAFYIHDGKASRFLTSVGPGLNTVEFSAAGRFQIMAEPDAGAVQYQTAEAEPTHSVVADPAIFTRLAQRRHRNPEMEEMMYRVQLNVERRLAKQASEIEAVFERRRREEGNVEPAGEVEDDSAGATRKSPKRKPVSPPQPAAGGEGEAPGDEDGSESEGGAT